MKCNHEGTRVFSDFSYATNPPKTPWICSKCGEKGIYSPDPTPSYDEIVKKFEEGCGNG